MITKSKTLTLEVSPGLLTNRQLQCACQLIQGKTAREIAVVLGLSKRTVEFYLDNIKMRLQCRNKSELIARLLQFAVIH